MIAAPPYTPAHEYIASLENTIVRLRDELQQKEQELGKVYQEAALLRKRLRLRDEVDATEHKPAFKVVANALVKHLEGHNVGDYREVETWQIAEQVKMPVPTVRKYISQADKIGIVSKRKETVQLADEKGYRTSMFLAPTSLLDKPRFWTPPDEQETKQHGGKRAGAGRKPKCEHCGSERIDPILTYQCLDCGLPTNIPFADLPKEMQPHVDAFLSFLAGGVDGVKIQDESSLALEELEDDWNEDEAESENEPESRVIFQDESSLSIDEVDEVNAQNESLITYKEDAQIETSLPSEKVKIQDESSLPDAVSPSISPDADAIDLLLAIAGTSNEHIIMLRGTGNKYTTIKRALHRGDMIAHLKGIKTVGSKIQHPFGLTRASCHEADNPHDWQRLKEAALLLAQAGFKPIVQPSPVRAGDHVGGGHLWLIFDKLVDAYSARQTMIDLAPQLAESKEYWPNGSARVRLPGGRYIHGGTDAWCMLSDAYGTELSHDGDGAAATLLAMQTPAALVCKREKKIDLVLQQQQPTGLNTQSQVGGDTWAKRIEAGSQQKKDDAAKVIAAFNKNHSWDELADLAGGFDVRGYFPAIWRGDGRTNAVKVHTDTDRAVDYGASSWIGRTPMDKYTVHCLIKAKGFYQDEEATREHWREFMRKDLDLRCLEYRCVGVVA